MFQLQISESETLTYGYTSSAVSMSVYVRAAPVGGARGRRAVLGHARPQQRGLVPRRARRAGALHAARRATRAGSTAHCRLRHAAV